nr:hypothetical protein HK105_006257 [Polyrhizophydium stewartii]
MATKDNTAYSLMLPMADLSAKSLFVAGHESGIGSSIRTRNREELERYGIIARRPASSTRSLKPAAQPAHMRHRLWCKLANAGSVCTCKLAQPGRPVTTWVRIGGTAESIGREITFARIANQAGGSELGDAVRDCLALQTEPFPTEADRDYTLMFPVLKTPWNHGLGTKAYLRITPKSVEEFILTPYDNPLDKAAAPPAAAHLEAPTTSSAEQDGAKQGELAASSSLPAIKRHIVEHRQEKSEAFFGLERMKPVQQAKQPFLKASRKRQGWHARLSPDEDALGITHCKPDGQPRNRQRFPPQHQFTKAAAGMVRRRASSVRPDYLVLQEIEDALFKGDLVFTEEPEAERYIEAFHPRAEDEDDARATARNAVIARGAFDGIVEPLTQMQPHSPPYPCPSPGPAGIRHHFHHHAGSHQSLAKPALHPIPHAPASVSSDGFAAIKAAAETAAAVFEAHPPIPHIPVSRSKQVSFVLRFPDGFKHAIKTSDSQPVRSLAGAIRDRLKPAHHAVLSLLVHSLITDAAEACDAKPGPTSQCASNNSSAETLCNAAGGLAAAQPVLAQSKLATRRLRLDGADGEITIRQARLEGQVVVVCADEVELSITGRGQKQGSLHAPGSRPRLA